MDISEDMLQVAAERFRLAGRRVSLIEGDIAHFSLHRPVNLITCVCDGVNYLTDSRDAQRFFDRAFGFLKRTARWRLILAASASWKKDCPAIFLRG